MARLQRLALLLLWLTALAEAGRHARGLELLFFYNCYRLDVEVSVAQWLADNPGKTPAEANAARPWSMAKNAEIPNFPEDADPPGGPQRYGMNFHTFAVATESNESRYARLEGRAQIADRWMPKPQEVVGIARWPFDNKSIKMGPDPDNKKDPNRYSYRGFDTIKMLGTLNAKPGALKNDDYFNFDNMLKIVSQRAKDLYERNPEIGRPYFENMVKCLKEAQVARRMEAAAFRKKGVWYHLQKLDAEENKKTRQLSASWMESSKIKIKGSESTVFKNWEYEDLDVRKTAERMEKRISPGFYVKVLQRMNHVADNWQSANPENWDPEARGHAVVATQEKVLVKKMRQQIADGGNPAGCGWDDDSVTPKNTKKRDLSYYNNLLGKNKKDRRVARSARSYVVRRDPLRRRVQGRSGVAKSGENGFGRFNYAAMH